ncbi:hypothetical protein SNOG_15258 [Parastagonospora nodorum SN15]|uniref:Integral membrane protein n=1 Tax=Phaeosphaeria nodorum (strain SN15 / ATCC MYA-4574 / FGSC 10173) TaxID=321614 RepID=Q0TZC5_PHANO|nr:hypothetical protein SNOG_15258 [Parastagonospora nodorum SN15]EAT77483.2 hypothetical protein SNOG_15258 [Parastagonospora nodorum SN15]
MERWSDGVGGWTSLFTWQYANSDLLGPLLLFFFSSSLLFRGQLKPNGSQPEQRGPLSRAIDDLHYHYHNTRPAYLDNGTLHNTWTRDFGAPLWASFNDRHQSHSHDHLANICAAAADTSRESIAVDFAQSAQLLDFAKSAQLLDQDTETLVAECSARTFTAAPASANIRRRKCMAGWPTQEQLGTTAAVFRSVPGRQRVAPADDSHASTAAISALNIRRNHNQAHHHQHNTMDSNVVDVLDVIDPEISALTTLNNVQNSLFLPNLPWLYNRQPTYDLGQATSDSSDEEMGSASREKTREDQLPHTTQDGELESAAQGRGLTRTNTIDSILSTMEEGPEHHYAVLPHGASLPGWTDEEKAILDDHVRHVLHSKRAKFKRTMRGFGRYVRNPLGFIVTLYFFLITFWGAAWVLFLIGWIYVKGRQQYFVEICDQVLTALFCVVGITMFPFRIVDTYHMAYVAFYAHRTWRIRKERGLAALKDHNELPRQSMAVDRDEVVQAEIEEEAEEELPVLTEEEQKKLEYHQAKLAKSHTFYRPTETYTHNAFSIRLLITIIVLLDCHSMFQCALGGTTWGIYYKHRPKALTAVILSCSLTCNITAGIIIGRGDKRSRKKLVVEQLLRQEITEEALQKLRKERGLKARGLMTKGQKKHVQKQMGEKKKNPLDTILHRG